MEHVRKRSGAVDNTLEPPGVLKLLFPQNFQASRKNRLDFRRLESVHAQSRPRSILNPRAATASAGIAGGACGGDGAQSAVTPIGGSDHDQVTQDDGGQDGETSDGQGWSQI